MKETASRVYKRMQPYFLILAVAIFILIISLLGSSYSVDFIMVAVGVAAGLISSYYLYRSMSQEKNIQLYEGETLILKSETPNTYFIMISIGDRDVPAEPIRSVIHLTSLGILAEPPGSGEVALFIPLDRIKDFRVQGSGLQVRYLDINNTFTEVSFFVDKLDVWVQTLANIFNATRA